MDTQIWYAIFSTVFGGVSGALSHVGEVSHPFLCPLSFPCVWGPFYGMHACTMLNSGGFILNGTSGWPVALKRVFVCKKH